MERWTQIAFQYRDDDGSETTATDRQAVNTDETLELDTNYRMRIGVQGAHTNGPVSFDLTVAFQYNVDGLGWNNITTASANVRAVGSGNFTDDDVTTEQLAQSQTFVAGHMDDDGSCTAVSISDTGESEFEICFQLRSADLSGGEAVEIRIVDSGAALTTYTQTPSITVASSGVTVAEIMAALSGKGQQEPIRLRPRPVGIGIFAHDMPEAGRRAPDLDWYVQASEPVRVKSRAQISPSSIDPKIEFEESSAAPESRLIGVVYSMSPSRVG